MKTRIRNRLTLITRLQALIRGLQKHYANESLQLAGTKWRVADLIALLQSQLAALQASEQAHIAWLSAVDTQRKAYKTQIAPLMALLRGYIESSAGSASDVFIDMGFAMRTATPPTVHTAAAAVEKRRATRAARHTKGKKQLKAIRGVVEVADAAPGAREGAVLTRSTD